MTPRPSVRPALCLLCALAWLWASTLLAVQQPDRSKAPSIGPPPELHLPAVDRRTLSNALPVWIVAQHKVPVVHVELAVRAAGSGSDPVKKFGLASLTADMLDEGAGSRSALEIADAIDYLGAELDTSSSSDASYVDLHVPVARLGDALPVMADVIAHPTFPDAELKRLREEALTALLEAEDDPAQLIQIAFPRLVYGTSHRYGTPSIGTAVSLRSFTREDLAAFHASVYRPQNATLVVTGDVTASTVVQLLERTIGQWKGSPAAAASPALTDAPQLTARHIYLLDKPGAAQSQIRIGWVGVARSTPDYFPLRVLNTILGGAFTSRLNQNLREQHGYAYGASSGFDMRRAAGPFFAAAGVQTDKTGDALKEFFNELTRIHELVGAEELEKAKNYLSLLLPRNFETTRATANALAQIAVYDLPQGFYEAYGQHVRAVTTADVKRVADKYIEPAKFAVVIVGDRKVIGPGVGALNLGPVTIVQAADVMK